MDKINIYFKDGRVRYVINMRDFYLSEDIANGGLFLVIKSRDNNDTPVVSKFPVDHIEKVVIG